jgi:hypothetical protein
MSSARAILCSAAVLAHVTATATAVASSVCAPGDNPADCAALQDFAASLTYKGWKNNKNWMSSQTVCSWAGVSCSSGRVTGLNLQSNNLKGTWPDSIGNLTKLSSLQLDGTQPSSYAGCVDTDFSYSAFPSSFWSLTEMSVFLAENACLGGTLLDGPAGVASWAKLTQFSIHQNRVSGSFPSGFNNAGGLQVLKLDRNPINGTVPLFTGWGPSLQKFDCNFCALSGPFPDMNFKVLTGLYEMYWDGNAFTSLPTGLGDLPKLGEVSFNINAIRGPFPSGLCSMKTITDCRVGDDTDCNANGYQGCYAWVQNVTGNLYNCPLPSGCAVCNSSTSPLACGS